MISLWWPVAAYAAAIFYVSSLEDPPAPHNVTDLTLHAAAYCGLMLLVIRAVARRSWACVTTRTLLIAWLVTVAYGASDEWHQMYVPSRHADLRDVFADAIGAFVAGIGAKAWSIIRRL